MNGSAVVLTEGCDMGGRCVETDVTAAQAAAMLGLPVGTVRHWATTGRLVKSRRLLSGGHVYRVSDVRRVYAEMYQEPPDGYVPAARAAEILGVTEAVVHHLMDRKKVRSVKFRLRGQPVRWACEADLATARKVRGPEDGLVMLADAAKANGVRPSTAEAWVRQGRLPKAVRSLVGKATRIFVDPDQFAAAVRAHRLWKLERGQSPSVAPRVATKHCRSGTEPEAGTDRETGDVLDYCVVVRHCAGLLAPHDMAVLKSRREKFEAYLAQRGGAA